MGIKIDRPIIDGDSSKLFKAAIRSRQTLDACERKLAGVYMENHETVEGVEGSYPTLGSYNLVFLTAGLLSAVSLGFALFLRRRGARKEIEV
ncbi:MAG: hypothetical protein MN733_44015 [Nitrososphaera sp.]|nr:hypothetical protein [Nitrososphaera sp.]